MAFVDTLTLRRRAVEEQLEKLKSLAADLEQRIGADQRPTGMEDLSKTQSNVAAYATLCVKIAEVEHIRLQMDVTIQQYYDGQVN